jgi:PLP dependent protein
MDLVQIKQNLSEIRNNIQNTCQQIGRDHQEVNIVAVTKYVSTETAQNAVAAGITNIGESRDEEFLRKYDIVQNTVTWHYIGTLQTRKVKRIINYVDYLHSLDRISLAEEIEKRAEKKVNCFVQVNIAEEETKHGQKPENVLQFIKELENFSKIEVVGLMTMAPYTDDQTIIRRVFKELSSLQKEVQALQIPNAPCKELSMGMSNDYEIAVEEGATFIRIGTSLVGKEC